MENETHWQKKHFIHKGIGVEKINYSISFSPPMNNNKETINRSNGTPDTYIFSPQEIILKDDAFHGSKGTHFSEWWYFDAALNNGYSIQLSVLIASALKLSLLFFRFDLYKDGHLMSHKRKIHLLKDVQISKEKPFIKLGDKTIVQGSFNEKTGNLIYDISVAIEDISAELQFIGTTKGWKGKHEANDWWAVVLPRASVNGTITLQKETITVHGNGYHDHNWNTKIFALKNIGWYWGKIYSDRTAITWANILRTKVKVHPLLVINTIHNGYINVLPKDFCFNATDISEENGKMIPHVFTLDVQTTAVTLHVIMKTVDIHHVKIFQLMDYWRYHVKCTGSITVDSNTESIDDLYIAEFLKFP
jgi:hypothetical protein